MWFLWTGLNIQIWISRYFKYILHWNKGEEGNNLQRILCRFHNRLTFTHLGYSVWDFWLRSHLFSLPWILYQDRVTWKMDRGHMVEAQIFIIKHIKRRVRFLLRHYCLLATEGSAKAEYTVILLMVTRYMHCSQTLDSQGPFTLWVEKKIGF